MYVPVASAVATQQDGAQDLLDASAVLPGSGFFPRSGDFALVLGNSVRVWGILALALKFLCSLFLWDFRTFPLAAMLVWPFSSVWLSCA